MNKASFDKPSAAEKQAFLSAAKLDTQANLASADEDVAKGVADLRAKGMIERNNQDKVRNHKQGDDRIAIISIAGYTRNYCAVGRFLINFGVISSIRLF